MVETYTFEQVKELMKSNEETFLKFFNSTVERLEKKITDLSTENILIKKEVNDIKEESKI